MLSPDELAKIPDNVLRGKPALWINPSYDPARDPQSVADLHEAIGAWHHMAPLLASLFDEIAPFGKIASPLVEASDLFDGLPGENGKLLSGRVFVKGDHDLPVAGSIKARGGVFEVMMTAIAQARDAGLIKTDITPQELARKLTSPEAKEFFAKRTIAVGSTGNLGLSVGIAARALGYQAVVHMSYDAKTWKVERLRKLGVQVVTHKTDYNQAVASARLVSRQYPLSYFVDDEDSRLLFMGYSAAAQELKDQLQNLGIVPDAQTPLILYLPCGIGGAPGGVAYGARAAFGSCVHPFFVEPVQSPSALVQMAIGPEKTVSVYDVGLTNKTDADGMAVATMSALVMQEMQRRLAGTFTVDDNDLLRFVALAHDRLNLRLEPSAAAGFAGPAMLDRAASSTYFKNRFLPESGLENAIHIVWATGGRFVPEDQFQGFLKEGKSLGEMFDFVAEII